MVKAWPFSQFLSYVEKTKDTCLLTNATAEIKVHLSLNRSETKKNIAATRGDRLNKVVHYKCHLVQRQPYLSLCSE